MNHFLGFFPNEKANYKIRKVVGEVGRVFKDFDIPVRWAKPESFHISLYMVGSKVSFIRRFFLKRKFSQIKFKPFEVSFGKVKLGISRKYRELIFLDIDKGGEEIRNLFLEISKSIESGDSSSFIPHLTIGRVSKELSEEEYRNLVKDIQNISKSLQIKDITFTVKEIYLINSKDGVYSPVIKFEAN